MIMLGGDRIEKPICDKRGVTGAGGKWHPQKDIYDYDTTC
jgi:hypothetical protein